MKTAKTHDILIVVLCLSVFIMPYLAITTAHSMQSATIQWKGPIPTLAEKARMLTYRQVEIKKISLEGARERARVVMGTANMEQSFDDAQTYDGRLIFTTPKDPSAVFDIDTETGSFLFNAGLEKYTNLESTKGLPTEKEAPEIALRHIEKVGALPENRGQIVLKRVGGLGMTAMKEGETTENFKKLVTVIFRRVLGRLPVQGPGSRMVVHLGENASLGGLIVNWAEVKAQKVPRDQVKTDEMVQREIERRLLQIAGKAEKIDMVESKLVLYDDGRGVIEPAVYVAGLASYPGPGNGKESVEIPVDFYVPALVKPEAHYPFHKDAEARWPGSESEKNALESQSK